MPPPLCSRKRSRLEDEYDSEEDEDNDDDDDDSVLSDDDDSSSSSDSDSDSDDDEDCFPHSKLRFASTTSSAKATHYRPPKSNWWNRLDRQTFVEDCQDILEHVPQATIDHYTKVWEQAHHPQTSDDSTTKLCLPTELRGLEWGLQSKQALRRDHVAKLLELQAKTKTLNHQFRERLLSNISSKMSRPSRVMAHWLAEGDAQSLQEEASSSQRHHHADDGQDYMSSTIKTKRMRMTW
jgi:hypothetical protein